MNPALQQLKDIHLPKAIPSWPIAPGWIALFIIMLMLVAYSISRYYQIRKQRFTVKYALKKLNQLKTLAQDNPNHINIAAEVSTLIRRTALYYFHRDTIAGLSGKEWINFLNSSTTHFTAETSELLIDEPYRPHQSADLSALFTATSHWLTSIAKSKKRKG